ncbi:MAG: hypothetical protein M3N59_00835 [bacterium]|nr:hypothetical protein [bacterium]
MRRPRLGVVIYTHDRVDDARINQEIIRNVWETPEFSQTVIVHAYNGKKAWYPKRHLEDTLVRRLNPGHLPGACDLIDAGIKRLRRYRNISHVVVLAGDAWLLDPGYVSRKITLMRKRGKPLASTPWGTAKRRSIWDVGLATQFFMFETAWAERYRLFPLDYAGFARKYEELLLYRSGSSVAAEKLLVTRLLQASYRERAVNVGRREIAERHVLHLTECEPVHKNERWERYPYYSKIGFVTHHDPGPKRKILKQRGVSPTGPAMKKLLTAKNLDYYNHGIRQHAVRVG